LLAATDRPTESEVQLGTPCVINDTFDCEDRNIVGDCRVQVTQGGWSIIGVVLTGESPSTRGKPEVSTTTYTTNPILVSLRNFPGLERWGGGD